MAKGEKGEYVMTRKKLAYLVIGGAILAGLILRSSLDSLPSSDIAQAARVIGSCCGF